MISLYNKNEKLVWLPKLRFDWEIFGQNICFTKKIKCSCGPSAHFGCSTLPYRPKKNHILTFLAGFVRPCYVNVRVSGPKILLDRWPSIVYVTGPLSHPHLTHLYQVQFLSGWFGSECKPLREVTPISLPAQADIGQCPPPSAWLKTKSAR